MGQMILPSRFSRQPQQVAPLDLGNSITKGMRLVVSGAMPGRAAFGPAITQVGAVASVPGLAGRYQSFNGSNQALSVPIDFSNTKAVTVVYVVNGLSSTGNQQILWEYGTDVIATSQGFDAYINGSGQVEIWTGAGGGRQGDTYNPLPAGTHTLVVGYDNTKPAGSQIRFLVDGVLQTKIGQPISSGTDAAYTANTLYIGSRTSSQSWINAQVALMAVADRAYSRAEELQISANPWQIFKAPPRRLWHLPTSTGPTYTISGSAGSLTLTGSGTRLAALRRITGAAASIALAASTIRLSASRRLPVATGALSVAGANGVLVASRCLAGDPGVMALSGASVKLIAARKIATQPVAFTLTGGSATFVYTPKPGGQGPTYTLTGGSGAFLLSASATRLLLARRLVAAAGAFSAAGAPVSMLSARRLPATAGTFGTTGTAAGLRATRRLPAAAASFALTGSAATFYYVPIVGPGGPTYTLTAVGGSLGLTGNAAGLRARRRLSGSAAQFAITGWAANLVYGEQIVYARAPTGSGYTPCTAESTHRPVEAATVRPVAIQRNNR